MSSSNVSARRVTGRQLNLLWEYLNSHREIAVAFNRSLQAKEFSRRKWKAVAEILSAQGERTHKDWKGWSKYWVDFKGKLKKRAAAVRASQARTGGGPSTEPPLTEMENKFLQILGEDFGQGLPGVRVEPFAQLSESTAAADVDSPSILIPPPDSLPSFQLGILLSEPTHQQILSAAEQAAPPPSSPSLPFQPAAAAAAVAVAGAGRRRRRREPYMSQEAARRALVESSQRSAAAVVRDVQALEVIGQGITNMQDTLSRMERTIAAAFPRAAEREHSS